MEQFHDFTQEDLRTFVLGISLLAARWVGLFSISPIIGSRAIPRQIRTGLVFSLCLIVQPTLPDLETFWSGDALAFIGLFSKEIGVGLVLGMLIWLPIRGIEFAGVLIDTQRGALLAQDFDVIFTAQTTPVAIFLTQTMTAYFFAVGGFLIVCGVMFESYQVWPVYTYFPDIEVATGQAFLALAGKLFLVSIIFALPIMIFMFLADIGIAFIAKTSPTLNALTFSMPVKSAIAILMLYSYIRLAFPAAVSHFDQTIPLIEGILNLER